MFICDDCLSPYSSDGDCTGRCETCRESFDEQLMIDGMSSDEYDDYMAAKDANAVHHALLGVQRSIRRVA